LGSCIATTARLTPEEIRASAQGGVLQRVDFGVRTAGPLVPALADNGPVPDHDTADARIRVGGEQAPLCESQGVCHEAMIVGGKHSQAGTPKIRTGY
jgi:hypothetical protein